MFVSILNLGINRYTNILLELTKTKPNCDIVDPGLVNNCLVAVFVNKVCLEYSCAHLLIYCLWLFSCDSGRIEYL